MKILQRYVVSAYLSAFALAMLVLTFVLSVGLLVKATELMVKGLPPEMVLRFLAVSMPESLTFTIPLASLVSALLVFGRLSADGEINAMKACGVNLWSVMRPPALFGVLMAVLCLFVNYEIAPRSHLARRDMRTLVGAGAGLKLLEPGHFIDFPGMKIWFSRREGDLLQDLLIFDRSQGGRNREVRAESARVVVQGNDLHLDMYRVRIEPVSDTEPGVATAARLTHILPDAMKPRAYRPSIKDYRFAELRGHIARLEAAVRESRADMQKDADGSPHSAKAQALLLQDRMQQLSSTRTEWHRRITLAVAACAFVLLGMPLGIRAQRRESTIGVAIGLVVTLLYYLLVISADALAKRPEFHPHLLTWVPPCLCVALSCWLAARHQ